MEVAVLQAVSGLIDSIVNAPEMTNTACEYII